VLSIALNLAVRGARLPSPGLRQSPKRLFWIEKVFYPVFPPNKNAEEVVEWLSHNPLGATLLT
jgi:hypothetical protein